MRVAITGVGVVSPLGTGARATMRRLVAGARAMAPLSLFEPPGTRSTLACEVRDVEALRAALGPRARAFSRADVLALVAAREALEEARLGAGTFALVVGGTAGGLFETELTLAAMLRDETLAPPREGLEAHPPGAVAARLREELRGVRDARAVSCACASGATALALAASLVASGRVERALAGGVDALARLTYAGFDALGVSAREPCRPFDAARAGLTLGEGAAFVVLEAEPSARARGAKVLAELAGWAAGAEAHHPTQPDREGSVALDVVRSALARAKLGADALDYVNAHGTGTTLNDASEASVLARALGAEAARVRVSSSKGQLGHSLGAAGAVEAVISVLAIEAGVAPPSVGLETPDPAFALRFVGPVGEPAPIRAALSTSFGFGGMAAALVLAEPGWAPDREEPAPRRCVVTAVGGSSPEGVASLDATATRRFDRASRLLASAASAALPAAPLASRTGLVAGATFGDVDGSAAFVSRLVDKGARLVSPAAFPNLVPSGAVGNVSILDGLRGPVLAVHERGTGAEAAIATAFELVRAGEVEVVLAGGVEPASALVARAFAPWRDAPARDEPRGEGATLLRLVDEAGARRAGERALARVVDVAAAAQGPPPWPDVPPRAAVFAALAPDDLDRWLAGSAWADAPRTRVAPPRGGAHDAAGAWVLAAAVAAIASGECASALAVGLGDGGLRATWIEAP